jgi:hypothetical protein
VAFPRKERAYEKYAWVLFFALGILYFIDGFSKLASYSNWVGLYPNFQVLGAQFGRAGEQAFVYPIIYGYRSVALGIFVAVLARKGFRRGERWVWYIFLTQPVSYALGVINLLIDNRLAFAWIEEFLFLVVTLLGLLLPYRKFFPKKQPVAS